MAAALRALGQRSEPAAEALLEETATRLLVNGRAPVDGVAAAMAEALREHPSAASAAHLIALTRTACDSSGQWASYAAEYAAAGLGDPRMPLQPELWALVDGAGTVRKLALQALASRREPAVDAELRRRYALAADEPLRLDLASALLTERVPGDVVGPLRLSSPRRRRRLRRLRGSSPRPPPAPPPRECPRARRRAASGRRRWSDGRRSRRPARIRRSPTPWWPRCWGRGEPAPRRSCQSVCGSSGWDTACPCSRPGSRSAWRPPCATRGCRSARAEAMVVLVRDADVYNCGAAVLAAATQAHAAAFAAPEPYLRACACFVDTLRLGGSWPLAERPPMIPELRRCLDDADPLVRIYALGACLWRVGMAFQLHLDDVGTLAGHAADPDAAVRQTALLAVAHLLPSVVHHTSAARAAIAKTLDAAATAAAGDRSQLALIDEARGRLAALRDGAPGGGITRTMEMGSGHDAAPADADHRYLRLDVGGSPAPFDRLVGSPDGLSLCPPPLPTADGRAAMPFATN